MRHSQPQSARPSCAERRVVADDDRLRTGAGPADFRGHGIRWNTSAVEIAGAIGPINKIGRNLDRIDKVRIRWHSAERQQQGTA